MLPSPVGQQAGELSFIIISDGLLGKAGRLSREGRDEEKVWRPSEPISVQTQHTHATFDR